ncbi:MAG TPA: phasin family protein [Stellaceae bacterium]|jgi:hypothetical protein
MAEAKGAGRSAGERAEDAVPNFATTAADQPAATSTGDAVRVQAEQLAAQAGEGVRQAGAATAAGADAALRSGSAITQGVQDITAAWARYGEEVMRQTADASRALVNCRSLPEMIEVQARLLRGNLQAFLDQSSKIAEIAGRIAARPFDAVKQAGADQPRP